MILCEERDGKYFIKVEGDTEEFLAEICTTLAAMCAEMKADPTAMIYDIAMNFLPGYPGAREQMLILAEWLRESAEELAEGEGVTS